MESSLKERLMTWAEKNPIPTTIIALAGIGSFTFLAMKSPKQVSIDLGTFKVQC